MSLALTYQGINSNAGRALTTKTVSSSTYTLLAADAGTLIRFTAACVVTVPANVFLASVVILCQQMSTGEVSFVSDGTLSLRISSVYLPRAGGQYAVAKISFISPLEAVVLADRSLSGVVLPNFSGATSGYSTRQLVANQTQIWEVHRGSDNATQIFGPDSSGKVDVAAIQTFLAGSQGRLRTWYDPIGGLNAVQTTAAKMPLISNASGIVLTNSKGNPIVSGQGGQIMSASISPAINSRANYTVAQGLRKRTSSTTADRPFSLQRNATESQLLGGTFSYSSDTVLTFRYNDGATTTNLTMADNESAAIVVRSPGTTATQGSAAMIKNGVQGTNATNTINIPSLNLTLLYLFGGLNGINPPGEFYGNVDISETIFWRSHLDNATVTAITNEINAYH